MFSFILDAFQFHLSQIKHVSVRELLHPFQLLLRRSVLTQREENQSKIQNRDDISNVVRGNSKIGYNRKKRLIN